MSSTAPSNSVHPKTVRAWRSWLERNHERSTGIWLISYKKATGKSRFDYAEGVEEALCFGWIDSKPRKLDEERAMLWFAPRKPGTGWSKANKIRVEALIKAGRMQPPGLAKVKEAQRDGSWSALDSIEALVIPGDLAKALRANKGAMKHFDGFPRSTKRSILEWISNARKPETRERRVRETAALAARNIRANQWRKRAV